MVKILTLGISLWLLVFIVRIIAIGGLDPGYRDSEVSVFLPLREYLLTVVEATVPYPESALLSGILLGEQSSLPAELKESLKQTSTIHMVVVSGQNLTLVAGFLMGLASVIGRKKAIVASLIGIIFFAVLSGMQVPVIRAGMMAGAAFIATFLGKEVLGWWVLLVCAGILLLLNPNWLLSISFQLSFLATVGVVVVAPILASYLSRVPAVLRSDLAVTAAAQLMVTPIIAANFNQISLVGILSNTLILFTIPLVMVSGAVTLLVGMISPVLGLVVGLVPTVLLSYFIYIVEFSSRLPLSSVSVGELGWLTWVGYYLIIAGVLWHLSLKLKIKS